MFRRNPFAKTPTSPSSSSSSKPLPLSSDGTNVPEAIPEDSVPIHSPIQSAAPQRPLLHTTDSWNDPPMSWTSQAAAYDVNQKYTTANQSYTHRRRKSSMITNLIAGQNDPYQPTYRDWRDYEGERSTPESPRGSWSLGSGVTYEDDKAMRRGRAKKCVKISALMLLLITLVLGGVWVFGGAMPLSNNPFGGTIAGDGWRVKGPNIDWRAWTIQENLRQKYWTHWNLNEQIGKVKSLKQLVPTALRRADDPRGSVSVQASIPATVTVTSGVAINPDLSKYGAGTLARIVRLSTPTLSVTEDEAVKTSLAPVATQTEVGEEVVVAHPVQVREESGDSDVSVVPTPWELVTDKFGGAEQVAHQSRVQELWKKHAEVVPTAEETRRKETQGEAFRSLVGTIADGVSPSADT